MKLTDQCAGHDNNKDMKMTDHRPK